MDIWPKICTSNFDFILVFDSSSPKTLITIVKISSIYFEESWYCTIGFIQIFLYLLGFISENLHLQFWNTNWDSGIVDISLLILHLFNLGLANHHHGHQQQQQQAQASPNYQQPTPWNISEANSHCVHVFDKLRVQREQSRFSDLILSVRGREFAAHR